MRGNIYDYDTMPEAKLILEAMKRQSKNEREEFIFFKKQKESYRYWMSCMFNIKIKFEYMKESEVEFVKNLISNMLYVVLGDMYDVENVLENTEFLNDVIEDIVCCADVDFNNDDVEIAFKRVMKKYLLK